MSEVLSPGVAYGCFELLDLIDGSPMGLAAARGLGKLGVVSAARVADCALALGWVELDDRGMILPTPRGQSVRALPLTELRLRRALLDLVEKSDPAWVQNARFGRRQLLQYAPPEISQLCSEAGLSDGSDADVVAFWDTLAARARGLHDVRLNEIGREGERLTLDYELNRTHRQPRWIALDSSSDGYDVLSCLAPTDTRRLCIEVKASRQGNRGSFYLTRHEWETATTLLNYRMHLWDLSRPKPRLAVVDPEALAPHLPTDQGKGRWETANIPFEAFMQMFEHATPDL